MHLVIITNEGGSAKCSTGDDVIRFAHRPKPNSTSDHVVARRECNVTAS